MLRNENQTLIGDDAKPHSCGQPPGQLTGILDSKRHALSGLLGLALAACGGGGGGAASSSPAGGGATNPAAAPTPATAPSSSAVALEAIGRPEASRFLGLASFGATEASIDDVVRLGARGWVDQQLALPQTLHMTHMDDFRQRNPGKQSWEYARNLLDSFYKQAVNGPDQLRQRVVFALSQIFVVSMASSSVLDRSRCHTSFVDMLGRNAFGNFRDLLKEVSTHAMMGVYLSHRANQKEDLLNGTSPDENYAREVMQLFSIGLVKLNPDGTPKLDSAGKTIPTYSNTDVSGLAKVFTGWSWAPGGNSSDDYFFADFPSSDIQIQPMQPYERHHSTSAKQFLGVTIPPNTTARPSLEIALDTLFNHPNTGPFISRQLIQRLVTSNPSPAYVSRVAAVFVNNGANVPGDMKAVIRAILLDDEARLPPRTGDGRQGKVREPVLRLTAWARAFAASSKTGDVRIRQTTNNIGQTPLSAPSVFNYYRPGFVPPGSAIATAKLVAPEMQIITESQVTGYINFMSDSVTNGMGEGQDLTCSYTAEMALASNPTALIDRMDLLLTGKRMSLSTRSALRTAIESVPLTATDAKLNRARIAVLLTLCSAEFLIQI